MLFSRVYEWKQTVCTHEWIDSYGICGECGFHNIVYVDFSNMRLSIRLSRTGDIASFDVSDYDQSLMFGVFDGFCICPDAPPAIQFIKCNLRFDDAYMGCNEVDDL